jgi:transposase
MPAKQPNPKRVASAVRAVTVAGRSLRDVADEYGVSYVTVLRWVNAHKAAAKPATKKPKAKAPAPWSGLTKELTEREPPPEEPPTAADLPEGATLLEQVMALQRDMMASAKAAKAVGNHRAAQAALASAGLLTNTIARIKKTEAEGSDVLKIPRHELITAADSVRKRLEAMRGRPLCCARCSRLLSIDMAYEGREKPDVIKEFEAQSENEG